MDNESMWYLYDSGQPVKPLPWRNATVVDKAIMAHIAAYGKRRARKRLELLVKKQAAAWWSNCVKCLIPGRLT